ncbi:MAG: hypothetical protein MJ068_04790, partial [Clostridia bacterium]|nr:hypothetical protein [Clostridia bacterium]
MEIEYSELSKNLEKYVYMVNSREVEDIDITLNGAPLCRLAQIKEREEQPKEEPSKPKYAYYNNP